MSYRLSAAAAVDIRQIYRNGVLRFGSEAAKSYVDQLRRTFVRLSDFPEMARERREFESRFRAHPAGMHVILYRIDDGILILRVRHGREDWQGEPETEG